MEQKKATVRLMGTIIDLLVTHFDFPRAMFSVAEDGTLGGVGSLLGLSFKIAACIQPGRPSAHSVDYQTPHS